MSLGIIIPVFNRKVITLRCLRQLHAQALAGMEIVVVDDGSTDGTFEAVSLHYPKVHIVRGSGNWWYTKSINEGLKYAEHHLNCENYLLLNDDIILSEQYLQSVSAALAKSAGDMVIYGSPSFDSADHGTPTFLGVKRLERWRNKQFHYSYNDYLFAKMHKRRSLQSEFIPGRGMFFSRKTLYENGYLDESFPQYGSDYEFSARGKTKGMKTEIFLDALLYSYEDLTGSGSPKNKPGFGRFVKGLFNKYSPTYPLNDSKLIWRHGNKLLMPVSFPIIVLGKFKAFLKYR